MGFRHTGRQRYHSNSDVVNEVAGGRARSESAAEPEAVSESEAVSEALSEALSEAGPRWQLRPRRAQRGRISSSPMASR